MSAATSRARGGLSRSRRYAIAGIWVGLLAGALAWGLLSGVTPADATATVVEAIQTSAFGPAAFLLFYLLRPLILFSAAVLTLAGGFLFGPLWGIVIVVIAANGSAMVAYGVARWVRGRHADDEPVATPDEHAVEGGGDGRLAGWTERLRRNSFETVLTMRLLYLPYDLVSYACGGARIHAGAFLAGTALGSAPATIWMVLLGASLESFDGSVPRINAPVLIVSVILLVGGLVVARLLRRREERAHGTG